MNKPVKPVKQWYTGEEIVDEYGIKDFQLFELMKAGVQVRTMTGKKVVDRDSLPKERRHALKYYENLARLEIGKEQTGKVVTKGWVSHRPVKSAVEIMQDFRSKYYEQLLEILNIPKGCKSINFTLPDKDDERASAISEALSFIFKTVDVVKYLNEYNQSHPLLSEENQNKIAAPQKKAAQELKQEDDEIKDYEDFISSLQVSYIDNTEVKVQYKGKRMNYTCESIGFRNCKTEEWKTFLRILEDTDHVYRLGPAYFNDNKIHQKVRINNYDSRLNLLKEINKKLVSFLTQQYKINFPSKFKLYERKLTQGKGAYSFKFQILSGKPSYNKEDQALERLQVLVKKGASDEEIHKAVLIAMEAGARKDDVAKIVQDMLPSQFDHEEIKDEPENDDDED